MKSPRYYISVLFSNLSDLFMNLSMKVSGQEIPKVTEEQTMTFLHRMNLRHDHPCPECQGKGWVPTFTGDSAICPMCNGLDVDPKVISRTMP